MACTRHLLLCTRLDGDRILLKYRWYVQDVFGLCGVGPVKWWNHRHVKASAAPPSGRPEEEPDRSQTWCELLPLTTTQHCLSFLKQLQTSLCETILKNPRDPAGTVSVRTCLFGGGGACLQPPHDQSGRLNHRTLPALCLVERVCLPPTFRGCRILSCANRKPLTSCSGVYWLCVLLAGGCAVRA